MAIAETNFETDAVLSLAVTGSGRLFSAGLLGLRARDTPASEWKSVLPRDDDPPFAVTAIEIAPDGTIVAGIPGGFGLSRDNGDSWSFVALPDPIPVITSVAIGQNHQLMLAGTEQDGVFRSVDGGQSWSAWNFGLLDAAVLSVAIAEDNSIYAGTSTGFFVSRNEGRSWIPVELPFDFDAILSIATQQNAIFAGTESNGLWTLPGGSLSWVKSNTLPDSMIPFIATDNVSTVVASGESGLWLSRDSGETWSTIAMPSDAVPSEIEVTSISHFGSIDGHPGIYVGFSNGTVSSTPIATNTNHP